MGKKAIVCLLLLVLVLTLFGCGGKSNDDGNANINIDSNSEIGIKVEFINAPEWLRTEYRAEFEVPEVKAKDEDGNEYFAAVTVKDSIQSKVELVDNKFTVTDKNGYTATYTVELDGKVAGSISVPITIAYSKYSDLKPIEYDTRLVHNIMIWDAPLSDRKTQEAFYEVAEAGYNITVPSFFNTDFGRDVNEAIEFLDKAHAAGLKMFVIDSDFCVYVSQWNPPGDNQPEKADTSNVKYYINHPAFLGLHISDEPYYRHFDLLAAKAEQFRETFPEDKIFYMNIWPRAAGLGNYGVMYDIYLEDLMQRVRPGILSYDHYPFDTEKGFWTDWFYSLEEIKYKAMEYNVPANAIMQVDGSAFYDKRHCSLEEIRWQMAAIMCFGYEYIAHYTYTPPDVTHYGVIKDGQKTQLYYDIQTANLEIRRWDHVYKSFVHGYQGTAVIPGSHGISDIKLDFFQRALLLDEIPEIKFVESSEYLLIGYFKDSNGNAGFMVTNATIPGENKDAIVTMEFDEKYAGLQVYDKGEMDIIRLEDNRVTFVIESSNGVFIIPLMASEDSGDMVKNEEITVCFDLDYDSATVPGSIKVKVGQPYGMLPTPPEREGYTFLGWRDGNTGFAKYVTANTVVEIDKEHTLYAQWAGNPVTLSYNLNEGTYYFHDTIEPTTVIVGKPYGGPAIPTGPVLKKEGFIFKGWYLNEDFSGPMVNPVMRVTGTTDHTIHAKWEPLRVYCDFEDPEDIKVVYDKLENLPQGAISIVERGENGNHMLKIDSRGAGLYNSLYTVISVMFEGFYMKPGQYLCFDIQAHVGAYDALQIFDEGDNELGDPSTWSGKHYLHTVTPQLQTIVVQPKTTSTSFRLDLWWEYGWIFYIDNIRITNSDPRR